MAKGRANAAERISALIAEIEAEAYARGRADARGEMLTVLGAAQETERPVRARRRVGGRAPRGAVRRLVERVLGERPGSTAREIAGRADDDAERSVKLSSIRVELRNGRAQERYASDNGRWSLAGTAGNDGAPQTAVAPGAEDAADAPAADPPETAAGGKEDGGRLGLSW